MATRLGEHIRRARLAYGMSQTVLAQRVGISKTSMNLIETGETLDPKYSIVKKIAKTLGMRIEDLDPEEDTHAEQSPAPRQRPRKTTPVA